MDRHRALKVRQTKRADAVTPVGGTQDRKQCSVLTNRQKLPVAQSPAGWGKITSEHPDFSKERFRHVSSFRLCCRLRVPDYHRSISSAETVNAFMSTSGN